MNETTNHLMSTERSSDDILAFLSNKYHTVKIVNKYDIQGYLLHSKSCM